LRAGANGPIIGREGDEDRVTSTGQRAASSREETAFPSLAREETRSRARLLGVLMPVHCLALIVGLALAEAVFRPTTGQSQVTEHAVAALLGAGLALLVAWLLLGLGRVRAASFLYLATWIVFPLTVPILGVPQAGVWMVGSSLTPILLATLALPGRAAYAVLALVLGACALELAVLPLPPEEVSIANGLLVVVLGSSVLLVVLREHHHGLAERSLRQLRESEAAVRASEQRLLTLLAKSRDVVVVLDREGALRAGYGDIESFGGRAFAELGSHRHLEHVHPEDHPRLLRELAELARRPGAITRTEWRHRHRDGSWHWIEALATNRLGVEGIDGIVLNLRDASDHKAAEETLRRSEARYRTLFNTVTDGIFLVHPQGRILEVNDAVCQRLGYTRDELLAMRIDELTGDPSGRSLRDELQRPGRMVFERVVRCRDGTTFPVEVVATLTEVDGGPAIMSVGRELTEQRRAEAEQRRLQEQLQQAVEMESIGKLAGGVAHDFNNLLTAILGNVELAALEVPAAGSVGEALAQIRAAATSAAALTRQLLTFSRKQVIEPRVLDLNQLLANMQKMLVRMIGESYELRTVAAEGLGAVRADPGLLEQAIVNLVVNARDAMPDGGVITLETANVAPDEERRSVHPLAAAGPLVAVAVIDTGSGMTDEVKAHLFEPFFTTKPRGQGTGLGLATTYGAIRQSGGVIEVESELGRGTTFRILLPAVSEDAEPLTRASPEPPETSVRGRETVLVVEDDPGVREVAARALLASGYRVLTAVTGEEALALAATEPIHLLLTDVVMPGMNGRELAARLLALHTDTRVLYTSGYAEDIIAHHGVLDAGVELLSKPYSIDVLIRRVRRVLDHR